MRRHHKRFDTGGGGGDTSVLESIFSTINSTYAGKIKYIATPGTPNSDIWLITESTVNSSSKTLVHVSTSGVIDSTSLSSCPYLGIFTAYGNKVLIVYKTSSAGRATWYYKTAQYDSVNNIFAISSQTTLSAKYISNMSDNLYTYNGSTFITIRGQMRSMETICTFNTSGTWTCSGPSKRTWAQFLTMTSAGKRRYFSGYSGTTTTEHQRNYKIYDSTNLSGNIETTLVGGDITYNTAYNNIIKRFYTSDSFAVFQYTNMNSNSQWTKYDFNSDYSNVSLGSKTLTMPSNRNASVFGSYQVFLESPTIMWFYNSSGNFEKAAIELAK